MTKAPITPGIHPQIVSIKIIIKDPHPLSITDNGGNKIASNTLKIFMFIIVFIIKTIFFKNCNTKPCIKQGF